MQPALLALGILFGAIAEARSPYDLPASEWNTLNATVGGRLARGVPLARDCFQQAGTNVTDAAPGLDCATVQSKYGNNSWRSGIYSNRMVLQWETCQKTNQGCLLDPSNPKNANAFSAPKVCNQGSVSPYYITVKTAADVTQAFAFSKRTGVPLSIKNTGHDHAGRSTAPGTLALWINYSTTFVPEGCNQAGVPALTYGAGQDMESLYMFAEANNITFIGGSARTIGAAGGWLQGGGHSILSNTYGLGVDRVLQFRVVTPDGHALVANACQNQDLFWALRGGGGGTFGLVLEATSQVVPNRVPTIVRPQSSYITWQLTPTPDNVRSLFAILVENSLGWSEEGWGGYIFPTTSILANPKLNATQAADSLKPLTDFLKNASDGSTGAGAQAQWGEYPSLWQLLSTILNDTDTVEPVHSTLASRLIPQSAFSSSNRATLLEAMMASWSTTNNVAYFMTTPFSYQVPKSEQGSTSVSQAWRGAVWHAIASASWAWDAGAEEANKGYLKASSAMNPLRAITPGGGAYQNEADVYEPGASTSFWGSNYPQLNAIKQKYDPDGLLGCWNCVGWKGNSTPIASCYL
ncbi:putative isoamyl alcohol oxidase [Rhizoctonia solani 123E]|uniref:Putative isoamyl alcohol oxidase n=1 Tax=Rhizoctonia solani 123E TaxID=1423351 RepID=A0A074RJQ0_9AGAM|nr:putative isoamyl alcohol oxidase [Rhizoctonia solani 123E]